MHSSGIEKAANCAGFSNSHNSTLECSKRQVLQSIDDDYNRHYASHLLTVTFLLSSLVTVGVMFICQFTLSFRLQAMLHAQSETNKRCKRGVTAPLEQHSEEVILPSVASRAMTARRQ